MSLSDIGTSFLSIVSAVRNAEFFSQKDRRQIPSSKLDKLGLKADTSDPYVYAFPWGEASSAREVTLHKGEDR